LLGNSFIKLIMKEERKAIFFHMIGWRVMSGSHRAQKCFEADCTL